MKNLFKSKKAIIIAIAALVAVIALVVVLVILLGSGKNENYRTVKIYQIDGTAEIYRDGGEPIAPYVNMLLEAGDEIKTLEDGYLYIKLDEDKYLMATPNSSFTLEAKGKAENGKTYIELKSGDIKVHVINPLNDGAEFNVSTGNSTMAIRGTSFGVNYAGENGGEVHYEVYDGTVSVSAPDGEHTVEEGKALDVSSEGSTEGEVDYADMDIPELEFIKFGIEQGNEMNITSEQIDDIIENKNKGMAIVTFKYGDRVFAVIPVKKGTMIFNPTFKPASDGGWDFDFSQVINEDTVIYWKKK